MRIVEKVIFLVLSFLIIIGVVWAWVDIRGFEGIYVREDGFIEWLTVLALLASAFLCGLRWWRFKGQNKLLAFTMLALAGVFIFGAGEEISWGQRIFGIESSAFFKTHNSQGETNLHNLLLKGKSINKIIFGTFLGICVGLYFLVLPYLYRTKNRVKELVDTFGIPIPTVFHIVAYLILFILASICVSPKRGELLEVGGCTIFFMMLWFPYNKEIYEKK